MKHLRKVIEFTPGWSIALLEKGSDTLIVYYDGQNGYWYFDHLPQPAIDALAAAAWRELDRQNKYVIIPMGVDRHRIYSRQPYQKIAEIEGDRSEAVIELIGGILE